MHQSISTLNVFPAPDQLLYNSRIPRTYFCIEPVPSRCQQHPVFAVDRETQNFEKLSCSSTICLRLPLPAIAARSVVVVNFSPTGFAAIFLEIGPCRPQRGPQEVPTPRRHALADHEPRPLGLLLDEVRVRARRAHAALVAGGVDDVAAVVALDERLRGAQQGAWGATGASTIRRRRPRDRRSRGTWPPLVLDARRLPLPAITSPSVVVVNFSPTGFAVRTLEIRLLPSPASPAHGRPVINRHA